MRESLKQMIAQSVLEGLQQFDEHDIAQYVVDHIDSELSTQVEYLEDQVEEEEEARAQMVQERNEAIEARKLLLDEHDEWKARAIDAENEAEGLRKQIDYLTDQLSDARAEAAHFASERARFKGIGDSFARKLTDAEKRLAELGELDDLKRSIDEERNPIVRAVSAILWPLWKSEGL